MNWSALAAVCSLLGVFATIIGVAFISGRMTEKIGENTMKTKEHADIIAVHGGRLNDHDVALGEIRAYQKGFSAAAQVSGTKDA
jgi:ABC-type lipoprotein release transport system permease subunit